jgi:hypothetical protein
MPTTPATDSLRQMTSILKLVDDDSPKVRDRMWELLAANLPAWEGALRESLPGLAPGPRRRLEEMLASLDKDGFRAEFAAWRDLPDEPQRLEAALTSLSGYLQRQALRDPGRRPGREMVSLEPGGAPPLADLLDALAAEFKATGEICIPSRLARFLFNAKGLRGADNDYYDPRNSDLVQVIRTGRGIHISLACVFMLVGRRLGLRIAGCDVPEHFLTRAEEGGETVIIDCYDAGRLLGRDRLSQLERKYAPDFNRILKTDATAESMVARVLRNLINAFHLAGDKEASEFMWTLAEDLRGGPDPEL